MILNLIETLKTSTYSPEHTNNTKIHYEKFKFFPTKNRNKKKSFFPPPKKMSSNKSEFSLICRWLFQFQNTHTPLSYFNVSMGGIQQQRRRPPCRWGPRRGSPSMRKDYMASCFFGGAALWLDGHWGKKLSALTAEYTWCIHARAVALKVQKF